VPRKCPRSVLALVVLSAVISVASTSVGDEWDDFHITIDPSSPTDEDTFDLRAFRWFPDSGYLHLDQSISVSDNQIDAWALIQDQHTRPDTAFLTVMTPGGAFFDDLGPLAAGTYRVNAEIWLTPWPATSGGSLYDEGSLQFTVTSIGTHQPLPGELNGDGIVDAADYVAWRKVVGATLDDYHLWRDNYGASAGSGSRASANTAAPEPETLLLLMFAAAGWCLRRGWSA
jgi:hypothetical protein